MKTLLQKLNGGINIVIIQLLLFGFCAVSTTSVFAQTFNANGTWTCPAGVTSVTAECWGAGGAGGGATGTPAAGGGGAGGSYVKNTAIPVTPGVTYTVTVGTGGTGGTGNGSAGGDSWFSTAGTILAKGGHG